MVRNKKKPVIQWEQLQFTLTCSIDKPFATEVESVANIAATDSLQISLAFALQVFVFTDANCLSPSLLDHLPHPHPLYPLARAWNSTCSQLKPLRLHQCKTAAQTLWMTPTAVHALRARPFSSLLCCQPDTYHQLSPSYTPRGRLYSHWEKMLTARAPIANCGPRPGPALCHWPEQL